MAFKVNPNQKKTVNDAGTVYKPGDIFPRKVSALLASGILIEVADHQEKPRKTRETVERPKQTEE